MAEKHYCEGLTQKGEHCHNVVTPPQHYCHIHTK